MEALCPANTGLACQFGLPGVSDTEHRVLIPEGWSCRLLVLWTSLLQCRAHRSPLSRRKLAQSAVRPLEKGWDERSNGCSLAGVDPLHSAFALLSLLCRQMYVYAYPSSLKHIPALPWLNGHHWKLTRGPCGLRQAGEWGMELVGSSSYSHWAEGRALWGWGLLRTCSPVCPVSTQSTQGSRLLDSTLRVGGKTKNRRLVKRYTSFPIIILAILTFQVLSGTHPEAEEPWSQVGQLLISTERRLTPSNSAWKVLSENKAPLTGEHMWLLCVCIGGVSCVTVIQFN